MKRKAILRHGVLVKCGNHKYKRQFKTRVSQPTNKCPICLACWLSDRLETHIYKDDLEDLIKFSNCLGQLKPSATEYIEEEIE